MMLRHHHFFYQDLWCSGGCCPSEVSRLSNPSLSLVPVSFGQFLLCTVILHRCMECKEFLPSIAPCDDGTDHKEAHGVLVVVGQTFLKRYHVLLVRIVRRPRMTAPKYLDGEPHLLVSAGALKLK